MLLSEIHRTRASSENDCFRISAVEYNFQRRGESDVTQRADFFLTVNVVQPIEIQHILVCNRQISNVERDYVLEEVGALAGFDMDV